MPTILHDTVIVPPTPVRVEDIARPEGSAYVLKMGALQNAMINNARKRIEAEHKILDQRLRDQQFYTRSLIESNIDALMATDPVGIISDVNKQMELLTGCTRDELIGTPFKKYFTDPELAEAGIKKVLAEKKVRDYELTARSRDGKETVVSYNASTFYDRNRTLQGVFASARDITNRKQAEQQILNLAFHDTLTQLPNRRLLNERLIQAMATSKRSGRYGALIFLDLDNFKSLNDTHGHCMGDLLLIEVAHRISSCVREVDIVARFGGDEFVVILSNLGTDRADSVSQATVVAEKIRIILKNPYVLKVESEGAAEKNIEHQCTSSIGVALFLDHEVGPEEVLKWADIAMYKAKEAGGNSIHFFDQ
jgi:diguanylate cyclase (GGDEF)-like protein/PAS domain S-box-containing protein